MKERGRVVLLIMMLMALVVGSICIALLYQAAIEQQRARLTETAQSQARLIEAVPGTQTSQVIGNQLLRSAASVAANYRATCRARSQADFVHKLGIAEEEAGESLSWLEMVVETNLMPAGRVQDLIQEAGELTAIFVASRKTAKSKIGSQQSKIG